MRKKNIFITLFLFMCVLMFPSDYSFASDLKSVSAPIYATKTSDSSYSVNLSLVAPTDGSPVYCMYDGGWWVFGSKSPFSIALINSMNYGNIYYVIAGSWGEGADLCLCNYYDTGHSHGSVNASDAIDKMNNMITYNDTSGLTFNKYSKDGTIDNPILDENIGTPILDKTIMYEESNGNDINDLYNLWAWKNKTSTGYSLSDNDYAQTFIQVKVESKCVIYSDLRHTKVKQNFDNYGEKGMLFNQIPVNNQPLKVSYLTDVPEVLPLTHAESHNPLYVGYNYTLYFRVVCTNSTQVIPDDSSSSEWHCGGWRAMDCNADVLNDQSDKSSNGHFDDDGNWIEEEDDGNNDVTSGSDSVHDTDDAKDSFANYQPSSGMTTDTAIGNLKDLMNMVGYIPTMIATLFSFLPSWCITLVAVTFASILVLIVYKLIRG